MRSRLDLSILTIMSCIVSLGAASPQEKSELAIVDGLIAGVRDCTNPSTEKLASKSTSAICQAPFFAKSVTPYEVEVFSMIFRKPFVLTSLKSCGRSNAKNPNYCFDVTDDLKDKRRGTLTTTIEDGKTKIIEVKVR